MAPLDGNASIDDLLEGLKSKLESEVDGEELEALYISGSQRRAWISTWSRRIDESNKIARLLRHRLNRLPAINRLPFEIFGEIFLYLQSETSSSSFQLPITKPNLNQANSWTKVTHVCRHWRQSAQNNKALWCHIALGDKLTQPAFLAKSFLKLSHPLPIKIEQALGLLSPREEEEMNEFYRSLLDHPDRIFGLYIRGHLPDAAWDLLQSSMPKIVEVELCFELLHPPPGGIAPGEPVREGEIGNFLGGHTSSLQKLSLEHYSWPRQAYPALTHLYLVNEHHMDMVFEDEFYDVLQALSSTLQFLYLDDSGPIIEEPDEFFILPTEEKILMPMLQHIEMYPARAYRDTNCLLMILHNLRLPKIVTIVWFSRLTGSLSEYRPDRWGMSMTPPAENLACVANVICSAYRMDCHAVSGKTLHLDPHFTFFADLEVWLSLLPNVVTLGLPYYFGFQDYQDNTYRILELHPKLKTVCLYPGDHLVLLLSDIEMKEGFCPLLEVLIILDADYDDIPDESGSESRKLVSHGLEPLCLSADKSMVRRRLSLQTTYTLRFAMGHMDGLRLD
ncbi:hypothetical protein GALMADRAFT_926503 [Galerina marginata CBS 339.88]|uniref:F-box domain-containing protein n=1 Tax=Galerina marginata (strain CBS 339.88) TaxID=685588 RepID=A0A067SEE4_GALM3|nr:hypothetical protein GALMADRAFT_926503 [Galerina marginata CBS 339.88]